MDTLRLSFACLGLALAIPPAAAQIGPSMAQVAMPPAPGPDTYGALPASATAGRLARPWQGTWVGADGHPNSGYWPGDLLTPDGREVGSAEFANFEGTAFIIVHPDTTPNADWYGSFLDDCHNKLSYSGFSTDYRHTDVCESWLRYYRKSGLTFSGFAYAVPVTLMRAPPRSDYEATECCRTVTREVVITRVIRAPRPRPHHRTCYPRLHDKRILLHDKRIRLRN